MNRPEAHIRRPMRQRSGSQWYRDRSERQVETFCGAPVTGADIDLRTALSKASARAGWSWCPACESVARRESTSGLVRRAGGA